MSLFPRFGRYKSSELKPMRWFGTRTRTAHPDRLDMAAIAGGAEHCLFMWNCAPLNTLAERLADAADASS
jgi:hypothetical protein